MSGSLPSDPARRRRRIEAGEPDRVPRRSKRSMAAQSAASSNCDGRIAVAVRQRGIGAMVEQVLDHLEAVVAADRLMERSMPPHGYPVRIGAVFKHEADTFGSCQSHLRRSSVLRLRAFSLPLSAGSSAPCCRAFRRHDTESLHR